MKFLNIAFIIFLVHQVHPFPTSSENSTETVITTETPDSSEITTTPDNIERTTKSNNSGKDDITVEEFILASVLYDDAEDDDTKKSTKVKRETPKEANKVVAKRALIFRPLFVYKQQEIKRQRVQEQRKITQRPRRTRPPTYGGSQPIG